MSESFTVHGLSQLKQRLLELPKQIRLKLLRKALRQGAKIVLQAAQARVPVRSGQLRQALVIRALGSGRGERRADARVGVGIKALRAVHADNAYNRRRRRAGKKYYAEGPAFYGRFLELGSKPHTISVDPKTVLANAQAGGKKVSRRTLGKVQRLANRRGILSDGVTIYGRTVQHPGTRARPFLKPALTDHVASVLSAVRNELSQGLEQEYASHA